MRVGVKICGITRADAIAAAAAGGAAALGFVFAPSSPRRVTAEQAAALLPLVPPGILRWAVFAADISSATLDALARLPIDAVQADADACAAAEARGFATIPVFRDAPGAERTLDDYLARAPRPPLVLFEGPVSGRGDVPDWARAARLARRVPLALAGGLNPANVGRAIATVRPAFVDVSSGVESAPGVKDPLLIAAFCAVVRETR